MFVGGVRCSVHCIRYTQYSVMVDLYTADSVSLGPMTRCIKSLGKTWLKCKVLWIRASAKYKMSLTPHNIHAVQTTGNCAYLKGEFTVFYSSCGIIDSYFYIQTVLRREWFGAQSWGVCPEVQKQLPLPPSFISSVEPNLEQPRSRPAFFSGRAIRPHSLNAEWCDVTLH